MEGREKPKPKNSQEESSVVENYQNVAKEIAIFADQVGENYYRFKTEYIALEFYRTTKDKNTFLRILKNSNIVKYFVDQMLHSRGINIESGNYPQEFKKEVEVLLNDINIEDRESFASFMLKISNNIETVQDDYSENRKVGMFTLENHLEKDGQYNVQIHLLSKIDEKSSDYVNPAKIKQSLEILCDRLIEQKRLPDSIIAKSWLMGVEAIRKRMGFEFRETFPFDKKGVDSAGEDTYRTSPLVWGQFLDKDGAVKQEELEYLLRYGKPKYEITKAEMPFPAFIEEYGQKYKGKTLEFIDFKKFSSELESIKIINKRLSSLREKLSRESFEEFLSLAKENDFWRSFLDTQAGLRFKSLIEEALLANNPGEFLADQKKAEMENLGKEFDILKNAYLNNIKAQTFTKTL